MKTDCQTDSTNSVGFHKAFHAVKEARARLAKAERMSSERNIANVKEVLIAYEVDLAWCRYYPLQHPWQRPPPAGARELSVGSIKTRKGRNKFWQIVKQSLEDGTLLDLRAGKFGGALDLREDDDEVEDEDIQSAGRQFSIE